MNREWMQRALKLAENQLGQVWPNPAVGCVIVKGGRVIAEAATAKGGRPHAEALALNQAGAEARGAEMFVTLEPCAHTGKTPPCVDAIIDAGIQKVIIACVDPDPRTAGMSIEKLKAAGIGVELGLCETEARHINRGFFSRIQKKRPHVMVKLATSADEKILTGDGDVRWVTGAASQTLTHQFRAHYDAVLTTINTVQADNPLLTCRLPGMEARSPLRVVLDRRLEISPASKLVATASDVPLWLITESKQMFYHPGVSVFRRNVADVEEVMQLLAEKGLSRVMVEAGNRLPLQLLRAGVVDEICWFRSGKALPKGQKGVDQPALAELAHWQMVQKQAIGEDVLEIYRKP